MGKFLKASNLGASMSSWEIATITPLRRAFFNFLKESRSGRESMRLAKTLAETCSIISNSFIIQKESTLALECYRQ